VDEDQREFAEFYADAWDDCLRIVTVSVGNRALGEDLAAEAFTRAWASWRKVRGLDEPRAWIIRCALNAHVSWWRRHRREVALGGHYRGCCGPVSVRLAVSRCAGDGARWLRLSGSRRRSGVAQ
jgi:DNA-directed RNA polymerase specialized sigma24 family protein